MKTPRDVFFVRSLEQNSCPCCGGQLTVKGSRQRKYINETGDTITLIIRRLSCRNCGRLHHELPDILVPYKRYGSASIEAAVSGDTALTVTADESTIYRWRSWFNEQALHFLGCLTSIATLLGKGTVQETSDLSKSTLQRIWDYVGNASGWLPRVVRPVANINSWLHTRFAFLS